MARAGIRELPLCAGLASVMALSLGMALGGCATGTPGDGASRSGASGLDVIGATSRAVERDVEAPEVFSMQEAGLWDGRPSLGGVWVAHPNTQTPERVLIRNTQSGATVIGALFRRERENPGPRFQISSEAANALGILPGAPTAIQVTALRLERIEDARQPPQQGAALPEMQSVAQQAESAPSSGSMGVPAGQVEIATVTAPEDAPRRGLFAGLFGRRSVEPAPQEAIAQTALAPAPTDGPMELSEASQPQALQSQAFQAAAAPEPAPRERRGLLGIFSRRTEAPEAQAEATLIPLPEADAVAPTATALVAAPAAALAPVSALDRPFVQIGIFSIETNATNARNQMQAAGLNAEIRQGRANERDFWRVVVGPAGDQGARAQIVQRVRAMGFNDAYAVVR